MVDKKVKEIYEYRLSLFLSVLPGNNYPITHKKFDKSIFALIFRSIDYQLKRTLQ